MDFADCERATTCCFTGHRPDKLPSGYAQEETAVAPLKAALRSAINDAVAGGYRTFLSGMALGVDTWAAEEVLTLRDGGHKIQLAAVLPCPRQDARWRKEDRLRYRRLLERADGVHVLCEQYTPYCMGARNLWMVERSSLLIAVFDGSRGGTANTVAHAERLGIRIVRIPPFEK